MLGGVTGRTTPKALAARSASRGRGAKRDAGELEQLASKFLAAVKAKPGERIEQLAPSIGSATKDLALPIRKLIASKQVKTEGERRATRYFPASKTTKPKVKKR